MSPKSKDEPRTEEDSIIAPKERLVVLIAALGAVFGGFFPWAQPLDLQIWGYDDGDGLITMSSGLITFLFVWLEWRQIAAGAAVVFGGFVFFVAAVNYTPNLGPGIVVAAISSVLMTAAGLSAVWKFRQHQV